MANAPWPAGLPQSFPRDTEFLGSLPNMIVTPMESGAPKRRANPGLNIRIYRIRRLVIDETQRELLEGLYWNTLVGGILPFDWQDPWRQAGLRTFFFREETSPSYGEPVDLWPVLKFPASFELEEHNVPGT